MDSKYKHNIKLKKSVKYDDMEKCQIKETREKPYQLQYLERLKEAKNKDVHN